MFTVVVMERGTYHSKATAPSTREGGVSLSSALQLVLYYLNLTRSLLITINAATSQLSPGASPHSNHWNGCQPVTHKYSHFYYHYLAKLMMKYPPILKRN